MRARNGNELGSSGAIRLMLFEVSESRELVADFDEPVSANRKWNISIHPMDSDRGIAYSFGSKKKP